MLPKKEDLKNRIIEVIKNLGYDELREIENYICTNFKTEEYEYENDLIDDEDFYVEI